MGHNFAGKFHIHFHLQLLTLCYLPSSKPMFYLCFNFQLVFDPTVLKTAKQIIYEESGEDGFVCFLNEPSARWNRYFSSKKNILFWSFQGQWLQIHGIRHVSRFPDSLWLDGDVQQACLSPAPNCCSTGQFGFASTQLRVDWALSWQLDLDLNWWLLEKAGPPLHLKIGTLKKKVNS